MGPEEEFDLYEEENSWISVFQVCAQYGDGQCGIIISVRSRFRINWRHA